MAEASTSNLNVEHASVAEVPHQSDYKVYLEAHPEMTAELMKVLVQIYQDPPKDSEAST